MDASPRAAVAQKARMSPHFKEMIRQATLLTRAGRLGEATAVIQRALRGGHDAPTTGRIDEGRVFEMERGEAPRGESVNQSTNQTPRAEAPGEAVAAKLMREAPLTEPLAEPLDEALPEPAPRARGTVPGADGPGLFLAGQHTHAGMSRHYKLFVPPGHFERPPALVVMLHGCTQDPDDFARGTQMNRHALEQGFFVLYPAQPKEANPMRCWNWFQAANQARSGEPALLTGMVDAVVREYRLDRQRVYVAGLSAGGAMAAILANAYPDVYAAAGVHSGLAPGAAMNAMAAFSVMKRGATGAVVLPRQEMPGPLVPVIVFQGDKDGTVHPRNGEQLLAAVLREAVAANELSAQQADAPRLEQGRSEDGQAYTRARYENGKGEIIAEYWALHGAGHAWAGGSPTGTYTDGKGPDATGAMLAFFFSHRLGSGRVSEAGQN
jgi:poly(hydroxyalkanoate) depolymerase family esterase